MALPLFDPRHDPGPDFAALVSRDAARTVPTSGDGSLGAQVPHGTTIAALRFAGGVVIAGDRRATEGNFIANRTIEKVFPADRFSGVGIAGAAGPAVEMVRIFQVQLEHYEKVEGKALSLEGKANQLAQMIRQNLPLAMQGLVVMPLFAGWDAERSEGRIFTFDVAGGRYEEVAYYAIGSGGRDARATLKLGWRPGLDEAGAVHLAVQALYEAAQEDAATGGPDALRGIFPVVAVIDREGYRRIDDARLEEIAVELDQAVRERGARR
nr:proteasome subunit beta [Acidimicrobium ferrooxidans]